MKPIYKFILVLGALVSLNSATAQSIYPEYTFQPSSIGSTYHVAAVTNGWMAPLNAGDCAMPMIAYISKNTGEIKYLPTPDSSQGGFDVYDILQTSPNQFICGAIWGKTADVLSIRRSCIYKMDSTGKIIWRSWFKYGDFGAQIFMAGFNKLVSSPDGSIYALYSYANHSYLAKVDLNGKKKWLNPT